MRQKFIPRNAVRTARLVLGPATYETDWGPQSQTGPHMKVVEPNPESGHDFYSVTLDIFLDTYRDGKEEGTYVKAAAVEAERQDEGGTAPTEEGPAAYAEGDWLVWNPGSDKPYPVSAATFHATYVLA